MKKFTSVKTRITLWYTALMLILISVVLILTGTLSYRLSLNSIENDIILKVSKISEKVNARHSVEIFNDVNRNEYFKNVSVYLENGEYLVGQYQYDVSSVPFAPNKLRRETVSGEEYIIYDVFKPARPGDGQGYFIRGAESISYSRIFGRSAFVILLFVIPLILILTAFGGYYITKKAFMPINNIIKTANEIADRNDVKQRIEIPPNSRRDELHDLSLTLNRMLDRIENLIIQEKQFTSDASHELRTPISVILTQGEYLLDIANDEKEKELAESIVTKAKQVSSLVSHLLLLARIDQSRQKLSMETVDLCLLTDISSENLKILADRKNISIINKVPEGLTVMADEALLLSAVGNLLSNGIKYGKDFGEITVSAEKSESEVKISIADNGIGISPKHIDKIWDRFYRVDDARNDEYGSNGLGLSMVKSIISLHGGSITVQSQPNIGTRFEIILHC